MGISAILILGLGLAQGCVGDPGPTLAMARKQVRRVLPDADLSGVDAEVWTSDSQAETKRNLAAEALSYPFARKILREQGEVFARLGLIRKGEQPLEKLIGRHATVPAFVVPSESLILVRPQVVERIDILSHELGHIASFRAGYWNRAAPYLWLHPQKVLDPSWVNLDAYIAAWAMEEGTAEYTAIASRAADEGETSTQMLDWLRQGALSPRILGPLSIRITQFAYGDGPRYISHATPPTPGLRSRLDTAWRRFSGTTREILDPALTPLPSPLAGRIRERFDALDPKPLRATRIGSFLLFQSLSRLDGFAVEPGAGYARALVDDVFLSWGSGRQLWITRWPDAETGHRFIADFRRVAPDLRVLRDGADVVLGWNVTSENAPSVLLP